MPSFLREFFSCRRRSDLAVPSPGGEPLMLVSSPLPPTVRSIKGPLPYKRLGIHIIAVAPVVPVSSFRGKRDPHDMVGHRDRPIDSGCPSRRDRIHESREFNAGKGGGQLVQEPWTTRARNGGMKEKERERGLDQEEEGGIPKDWRVTRARRCPGTRRAIHASVRCEVRLSPKCTYSL